MCIRFAILFTLFIFVSSFSDSESSLPLISSPVVIMIAVSDIINSCNYHRCLYIINIGSYHRNPDTLKKQDCQPIYQIVLMLFLLLHTTFLVLPFNTLRLNTKQHDYDDYDGDDYDGDDEDDDDVTNGECEHRLPRLIPHPI